MVYPNIADAELTGICQALADTNYGFTGSVLGRLLSTCAIKDCDPNLTKYKRLYNALLTQIKKDNSSMCVFKFIHEAMKPARNLNDIENHEKRKLKLNEILLTIGLMVNEKGEIIEVKKAETISEVQTRTLSLRRKLSNYGAHPYVIKCCRDELLKENYFHAVQEAAKSIADRVRELSGLKNDGCALFDSVFSIKSPILAMNSLQTASEQNQQNGLRELINGAYHMYRNVTAHELKIRWDIQEEDAISALNVISVIHLYLDKCILVPK